MKPKITVYVRSMKVPAGETLVEEPYLMKRATRVYEISKDVWYAVRLKKIYRYVLPDDQKEIVDVVEQLSEQRGFELKIIDMTREDAISRLWKKLMGIKNFPVVETKRGKRLQAPFSQSELESFVSRSLGIS